MHILGLLFLSLVKRIKAPQREVPDLMQPLLRYLSSCFLIWARSMGYFLYHLLSSNTESVTGSILYLIFLSKGMPGCSKKSLNLPKINFQCKSSIPGPLVFSHPPPSAAFTPLVSSSKWGYNKPNQAVQLYFTLSSIFFKPDNAILAMLSTGNGSTLCRYSPTESYRE